MTVAGGGRRRASARGRGREAARGRVRARAGGRGLRRRRRARRHRGLWLAREHAYDAIVLDIMLPGINGYKVCATLRDEGVWTPILMLTAKDGEYDEAEALDTGADDFLTKPFSFVVLVARLRALLRRGARRAAARCSTSATSRLDPAATPASARRRRDRADRPRVRVARVPDAARRRRRVEARDPRPRVGLRLRGRPEHRRGVRAATCARKIDRPFGRHAIETVRGRGYRLRRRAEAEVRRLRTVRVRTTMGARSSSAWCS